MPNTEKLFRFPSDHSKSLGDFPTTYTGKLKTKDQALDVLMKHKQKLEKLQDKLYAYNKHSVLIIFQAMDAAGKDGTIKHVMSGVNPQGCQVKSFKKPSDEELDHAYLWRCSKALPERGNIGIFNRSYYEEVLVARVHPVIIRNQNLPNEPYDPKRNLVFWNNRYNQINNFEKYLVENGTIVLKFFLNVSKEEQKQRFLSRIEDPSKNWKISVNDFKERQYWDEYMKVYEQMLLHTSTEWAPWFVIPADIKYYMRVAVIDIIVNALDALDLQYPRVDDKQREEIIKAKKLLESEE